MAPARYPYVHLDVPTDAVEAASSELWELGALGVEERDDSTLTDSRRGAGFVTLIASFSDEDEALAAADAVPTDWSPRIEYVVGDEWRDAWREYFKPTRVGRRLVVRPSWERFEAEPSDVVITLDPGAAFGTGTHETTRLLLHEIDARITGGERVFDFGCGSGILSIGALLLGADSALATDIDPLAVEVAQENAGVNGVGARLHASTCPVESIDSEFDVVVANIEHRVLLPNVDAMTRVTKAGGLLMLSGLLKGQEDDLVRALPAFELVSIPEAGEWVAVILRRRAP